MNILERLFFIFAKRYKRKKMDTLAIERKVDTIKKQNLKKVIKSHKAINELFESNQPIPESYTKDFVCFPLSNNSNK